MVAAPTQRLKKDVDAESGIKVEVGDMARVVRDVYPKFKNLKTLTSAYKATEMDLDGSMDLAQFESMLKKLVLFNNEARTFAGACVLRARCCTSERCLLFRSPPPPACPAPPCRVRSWRRRALSFLLCSLLG
jgi:hypothetical protein